MKSEVGFILGALEDGCLTKREKIGDYTIEFDQKNREWLEKLSEKFELVFKKKTKLTRTKRGYYRLRIHSKDIFEKLENLQKQKYNLISNSSIDVKKQFLRGIFDAESSVHPNRYVIAISNKDKKLLRYCRNLLKEFEINTGKICKSNKDVFEFCIYGKDNLKKYHDRIGFSHPNRKMKLLSKLD